MAVSGDYPEAGAFRLLHPDLVLISRAARSRHPGGVQALLGDGRAVFVANGIHLETWQALGSPAGGEVVGDF